jgi:hypothetical protein
VHYVTTIVIRFLAEDFFRRAPFSVLMKQIGPNWTTFGRVGSIRFVENLILLLLLLLLLFRFRFFRYFPLPCYVFVVFVFVFVFATPL